MARALATGKSGYVALWVQTLSTSYYAQVAHAMEESLEKRGYQIAVTPFGRIDRNREGYLGAPAGVDGVIAHEIYGDIWPLLFRHSRHKVPVVTTGILAPPESRDHVHVVITDAAAAAMNHLADTGRSRIAYAANGMSRGAKDPRYIVYHSVLAGRGLTPELIDLPYADRSSVRVAMREYFARFGVPGALLCHNDDIAIAAYRALCDMSLYVPQDCALVGCDGIPDTEYLSIPITTIVQPFAEISETACRFLQRRLAEPDAPPQRVELSAVLEVRASSQV